MPSLTPSPRSQAILSALMARGVERSLFALKIGFFFAIALSLSSLFALSCVSSMFTLLFVFGADRSGLYKDMWMISHPLGVIFILTFCCLATSLGGYARYRRHKPFAFSPPPHLFAFLLNIWQLSIASAFETTRDNKASWARSAAKFALSYLHAAASCLAAFPLCFLALAPVIAFIDIPLALYRQARFSFGAASAKGGFSAAIRARADSLANEGAQRLAAAERKALEASASKAGSGRKKTRSL